MPQKKKKTNKKSHKKKHINQNNKTIIYQSIPNYSSTQSGGHQINKNVSFGPPQQQETRTDNLVGDLVGKLISKIETDKTQQTQDYSKEIQPINNNNNVNIYNNSPGTTTTTIDKKTDETPSQTPDSKPESKISDAISNSVKGAARSAGEDFALQAGAGLASIATAALGTAGIRNRKAIRNSISNFPSNARNSLGSIRERFRSSSAYRPQVDVPASSVTGSPAASVAASSRRPSNASSQGPMDILSESIGMSPARTTRTPRTSEVFYRETDSVARRNRPRSDSITSESNYNTGNLAEQFSNVRTPVPRKPALNTEQRGLLERTLKNQNIDPSNISPIRQDVLRGSFTSSPRRQAVTISNTPQTNRLSGIQQHDGVNTRSIRAQTGEPHAQLRTPARGRPRIRPFGPQTQPNRRGRPSNEELAARTQLQTSPQAQTRVPQSVTRKMGSGKKK